MSRRSTVLAVLATLGGLLAGCAAYDYQHSARVISAEFMAGLSSGRMVSLGRDIVHGRGLCFNCHRVGKDGKGQLGPDLEGVGARARTRVEGMSDIEYLAQSLYTPDAFIVPNFQPSMIPVDGSPINLTDEEIVLVIAYLQSLGGEVTIAPDAVLP